MRTSALMGLLLGIVIGPSTGTLTAQSTPEGPATVALRRMPRVRANEDPTLAALLVKASGSSSTFRRLVATNASPGTGHPYSRAWTSTGRKASANLTAQTVVFEK
jgi:hypothetical protein